MHHPSPAANGSKQSPHAAVLRQLLRRVGLTRCVLVLLVLAGAVTLALPAFVLLPAAHKAGETTEQALGIPVRWGQQPEGKQPEGKGLRGFTSSSTWSAPTAHPQVLALAGSGAQVPPLSLPGNTTPIHFLISAFQDGQRCANTLFRALVQARHPGRISFNVLQAVGPEDVLCLDEFREHLLPTLCGNSTCAAEVLQRVRFWTISLEEGKGPVHQRGLLNEVADLSGEGSMCLSTDSHMDFTEGWDGDLLEDWTSAQNEFAVTSAYPMGTAEDGGPVNTKSWVSLCGYFLTDRDVPRGATGWPMEGGVEVSANGTLPSPQLTMNWAAGQSFSRCHAERNVPPDKHLLWTFNGEEVNRAVRLWTHGYDLYNPRVNVVLHNYTHPSQKYWNYATKASLQDINRSEVRLKALLHGTLSEAAAGRYGLGNQRTLTQYVTHFRTSLSRSWTAYLKEQGIRPHYEGIISRGGDMQPGSVDFCADLKRFPVRDAGELVASTA